MNRDIINSVYCQFKKKRKSSDVSNSGTQQPTINEVHIDENTAEATRTKLSDLSDSQHAAIVVEIDLADHEKGGRPSGSTNYNKRKREQEIIAMKNDIANKHKAEYDLVLQSEGKRVPNGRLKEVIGKNKKKRNLEDVDVPQVTI